MSSLQTRILWTMAAFSVVFNSCVLGFCLWHDSQMKKAGINISEIVGAR